MISKLVHCNCAGVLDDPQEDQASVKQTLVTAFKTDLLDSVKEELRKFDNQQVHEKSHKGKFSQWSNTWWQQFSVLFRRGMKERKHESFSGLKIGQVLVVAFLCGLLWWQSKDIQDQVISTSSLSYQMQVKVWPS